MQELSIKRALNDETRKQGIWMWVDGDVEVFSLHITTAGEVIITDNKDYTRIYSVQSLDFFKTLEKNNSEDEM